MRLNDLSFIDLFAGIGGFRTALEHYGATCIFSSEIDKYAAQTYEANYGEYPAGDITKIAEQDIPAHDILCAGFPCQPFSISGNQQGFADERGIHFFEICRIASYHSPRIMFLENVSNLKKHDEERTINTMIETLQDLEYTVFYDVLNASDYNVPQSRKRIYFICFRNDAFPNIEFEFPEREDCNIFVRDILQSDEETEKYRIIRDDIVLRDLNVNETQPKPIRIGTINKGGQGERIYSILGHAITLSANGGGPGAKTGAYLVNGHVRKLSPRECARVQGYPETFVIPVSDSQAWKQFGNSVALPVLIKIVNKIQHSIERY